METPLDSARPDFMKMAARIMQLTDRERLILRLRFALDGSYYHTLTEIAAGLHITPDDVRDIEEQALRRLEGSATT